MNNLLQCNTRVVTSLQSMSELHCQLHLPFGPGLSRNPPTTTQQLKGLQPSWGTEFSHPGAGLESVLVLPLSPLDTWHHLEKLAQTGDLNFHQPLMTCHFTPSYPSLQVFYQPYLATAVTSPLQRRAGESYFSDLADCTSVIWTHSRVTLPVSLHTGLYSTHIPQGLHACCSLAWLDAFPACTPVYPFSALSDSSTHAFSQQPGHYVIIYCCFWASY